MGLSDSLYAQHSLPASRSPRLSAIFQCTGRVQLVWACELAAARGFLCRGWWESLDLNQTDQWTKIMSWKWLRAAESCRQGCCFSVVVAVLVILSPYRESFDSKLISAMLLNGDWRGFVLFSGVRFYLWSHGTALKGLICHCAANGNAVLWENITCICFFNMFSIHTCILYACVRYVTSGILVTYLCILFCILTYYFWLPSFQFACARKGPHFAHGGRELELKLICRPRKQHSNTDFVEANSLLSLS